MSPTAVRRVGRVLVVGAINVDLVVAAARLPGPGETVVGAGVQRHGGGKGANAAVAAARAGAAVTFVGALGVDSAASEAEYELRDSGVDCDPVARLADHPTGMALIVVDPDGENQIAVGAGANHALEAAHVAHCVERLSEDGLDCVLVSTEVPDDAVCAAVRAASRLGVTCVLNPAPPIPAVVDVIGLAPILTPNRGELAMLLVALARRGDRSAAVASRDPEAVGSSSPIDDPETQARTLGAITGAPVCVTLGEHGVLLCDGEHVQRIPALAMPVRDATGAGDTFNGVLAAWLAAGAGIGEAARAATAAASLSVGAIGARTGMPGYNAILRALA